MKNIIRLIGARTLNIIYLRKKEKNKPIENKTNKINEEIRKELVNDKIKPQKNNLNKITLIILLTCGICIINLQIGFEIGLTALLILSYKKSIPKIKENKKREDILKNLPFALRQLSTQLKAGIGLFDALKVISNSDYGQLSREFKFTLNEIQYGTNYIEAFKNLSKRVNSNVFDKVINQIIRTLTNGGNLADTLNIIACENSENMKIKYKEYSEKLNSIMLIYMFIAVLIPVILFIMIIAATTVMGSIIEPEILLVLYLFFFPMIIVFVIIFIKRLEPTL